MAIVAAAKVSEYRTAFEIFNDRLNTIQAEIDATGPFPSITTYEARAMVSDLHDMMNAVELLARTIREKSIRPVDE